MKKIINKIFQLIGLPSRYGFYSLSLEERIKLGKEAALAGKTLISRWQDLASEETGTWTRRAERAAQMIGSQESVVDLGCGMMALERYLPMTTRYIPVDVVRRDRRTTIVDINEQELPDLGGSCIVGLGIFEYIYDLPKVIRRMSDLCATALVSYNALDDYPDQETRLGHAWVNSLTIHEFEELLSENGFQIDEKIRDADKKTFWRLSSLRFQKNAIYGASLKEKRIVITCDFLRTSDRMNFDQRANVLKIFDIVAPYVRSATPCPVELYPDNSNRSYVRLIEEIYSAFGLTPSRESWAKIYHASSLGDHPEAEKKLSAIVQEVFSNSLVISFEMSPMLKKLLELSAIPYVDIRACSLRFLDDLPLSFLSNKRELLNQIQRYRIPQPIIDGAAGQIRSDCESPSRSIRIPENSIVFLGQTQHDSSVILPNGTFFDIRHCFEQLGEIARTFSATSIVVKPHPLQIKAPAIQALLELPNTALSDSNVYQLLCSPNVNAFVTYSSSTGHEAEAFGRPVRWLSETQTIRDYIPVMWEYRTPEFWASILAELHFPIRDPLPQASAGFEPGFIRRSFGITWDARSNLDRKV